jgi:hypothetical protein
MEQMRDFDFVMFEHDVLVALGGLSSDVMSGLPTTVAGGLIATQTSTPSLTINMAAGRIYQFAPSDSTADGSIPQDLNIITQQGYAPAQTITLIAPSAGQSQWNLIQAQFSQVDAVRTNDPNGGNVPFYNVANPTQPTINSVNTVRKAVCVLQVISGSAATTGSEAPPTPTSGWIPLYLIDLAGGQSQITTSQIKVAGPSVGVGVPSTYAYAPFLAGLLASHHGGTPGQAPKIKLGSEVQGVLPYINMSPVRTSLSGNLTLYVGPTGSDANSGLTPASPFQTIQGAVNAMYHNYDWGGFAGTISVANGSYGSGVLASGLPPGMFTPINIVGNVASPGSVNISVNGNCFYATQGASLNVSGVQMQASGTIGAPTGYCLFAWGGGILAFGAVNFGAATNGHIFGQNCGTVALAPALGLNYLIFGGAQTHISSNSGGIAGSTNAVVTVSGAPGFANFATAGLNSLTYCVGSTYGGTASSVTGVKYNAVANGVIVTLGTGGAPNVNFFPGNAAGVTSTGGLYY